MKQILVISLYVNELALSITKYHPITAVFKCSNFSHTIFESSDSAPKFVKFVMILHTPIVMSL